MLNVLQEQYVIYLKHQFSRRKRHFWFLNYQKILNIMIKASNSQQKWHHYEHKQNFGENDVNNNLRDNRKKAKIQSRWFSENIQFIFHNSLKEIQQTGVMIFI